MAGSNRTVTRTATGSPGGRAVRVGVAVALLAGVALWTVATGSTTTQTDRIAVFGRFVHLVGATTLVGGLAWQHGLLTRSTVTDAPEHYRRAFVRFDRIAILAAGGVFLAAPAVALGAGSSGSIAVLGASTALAVAVILPAIGGGDAVARHRGPVGIASLVAGVATLALAATAGSSVGIGSLVAVAAVLHVLALAILVGGMAWVWPSQPGGSPEVEHPGADRRRWWFRSVAPIAVLVLTMTAGWQVIGSYIGTVGSPGGASLAATPVGAPATLAEIGICFVLFALFAIGSRVTDPV